MRVVQFLQVIALLALLGYVVLLQLENPVQVRLPLPGGEAVSVPLGLLLGATLVAGTLYAALLFTPLLVAGTLRRRREALRRRDLEGRLSATLQAKLAAPEPTLHVPADELTDPTADDAADTAPPVDAMRIVPPREPQEVR